MEYWSQMAVFLFAGTITHCFSDLSSPLKGAGRRIFFLPLHCALYAAGFIPLFLWMHIGFPWLIFVFGSHLLIDSQSERMRNFIEKKIIRLKPSWESIRKPLTFLITLGLDQILHLSAILAVAIFIFGGAPN